MQSTYAKRREALQRRWNGQCGVPQKVLVQVKPHRTLDGPYVNDAVVSNIPFQGRMKLRTIGNIPAAMAHT